MKNMDYKQGTLELEQCDRILIWPSKPPPLDVPFPGIWDYNYLTIPVFRIGYDVIWPSFLNERKIKVNEFEFYISPRGISLHNV